MIGRPLIGRPLIGRPFMGRPLIGRPLIGRPLIGRPLIGAGVTPGCAGAKALSGMVEIESFEPDMLTAPRAREVARHARLGADLAGGKRGSVDHDVVAGR